MKSARILIGPTLIAALGLAYFGALVGHPTHTLYSDHSDLIALHVPWETFLARSWQESGEMPLWNPLQFAGLPFAHDIQAATAYPPHWIFGRIDPSNVGAALSWMLVLHVILAGWGAFAYARFSGLGRTASLVAAIGFMFAGKWLLHLVVAGHYAFIGLAWLPWATLGIVKGLRQRDVLAATWGGVGLGLMAVTTHPQLMLYSGLFLAAWTLATFGESPRTGGEETARHLVRWIGYGAVAAAISIGVAAAQIGPSLEMAAMTTRGVSGAGQGASGSIRSLIQLLGPSPSGIQSVTSWESKSGIGVVWIVMALLATIVTTGTAKRRASRESLVVLGLIVFAAGGSFALQGLQGFRLFREPGRMFLIAAFPLSLVAATSVEALLNSASAELRGRARRIAIRSFVALLVVLVASALSSGIGPIKLHPYWLSLAATVPASAFMICRKGPTSSRTKIAWALILLSDVASMSWPHVSTRPLNEVIFPSPCARFVAEHVGPLDRVLDRGLPDHSSSTPLGPAVSSELRLSQVRGYNPLDLARFKDYLRIVADPVPVEHLMNGLSNVPILHPSMLDLLGVRFLVQPVDRHLRSVDAEPSSLPGWEQVFVDPRPRAFTFARGGIRDLPAYEVLENQSPMPRAFVAPTVAKIPRDRAGLIEAMTATDFRKVALVEADVTISTGGISGPDRWAKVRDYRANRIVIHAQGPGLLVLTDPWFPGWTAEVDGRSAEVVRADYLFRGVALSTGFHEVTMSFRPRSVIVGRTISLSTCLGVLVATVLAGVRRRGNSRIAAAGCDPHRPRARLRASTVRSRSIR